MYEPVRAKEIHTELLLSQTMRLLSTMCMCMNVFFQIILQRLHNY